MGWAIRYGGAVVDNYVRVAVTGATGFVGRYVVRALRERGDSDIIPVSRSGGVVEGMPSLSIDLADDIGDIFTRIGAPDAVIHCAWSGLPNYRSPHHLETDLEQQSRFLMALSDQGLRRLVGVGTCFEYGMIEGELNEDMQTEPDNPYGIAKDHLNRYLESTLVGSNCHFAWARLFYMFGKEQAPTSLYSLVNAACDRGDDRFPMSGGEQVRDFLPVETVATRLVQLALDTNACGTFNICSGEPQTVRSLVERWFAERKAPVTLELGVYPYPDYEPFAFWGSPQKFAQLFPE
jgi:nucleoside-diphosphate-sugar epimerase